ncbi:MAG: helix-turn-helix domain-containing protein [Myxococcota bacterium]
MTHRIAILDLPEGLRTGFALSCDILAIANRAADHLGSHPAAFEPIVLRPDQPLPDGLACVILPGMGSATYEEVAQILASEHGQWAVETLRQAHDQGVHIGTSCAGVFVAASAGVLDGKVATTSWFLEGELAARYPAITVHGECVLVESGTCLTGGAAMAHADMMLAVVERLAGATVADLCASYLLLDRRQTQRPYVVLMALIRHDPQLMQAYTWVRDHIAEPFYIADVAASAALGPRTLARRLQRTCGLTPIQFVQRIRVDMARTLMAQGMSAEAAATEVGYADATALRRVLRQHGRH